MLYPRSEDESMASPASLEGVLEQVQLGYLCSRTGGLGATRDWQDELSLGEQQVREQRGGGNSWLAFVKDGDGKRLVVRCVRSTLC